MNPKRKKKGDKNLTVGRTKMASMTTAPIKTKRTRRHRHQMGHMFTMMMMLTRAHGAVLNASKIWMMIMMLPWNVPFALVTFVARALG